MKQPKQNRISIREEQKLLTRDRFLEAAIGVFEEVGFRAATIDMITTRAGANRATFYLHFKDKLEVAAALATRNSLAYGKRFRVLDDFVNPTIEDVRLWLKEQIEWGEEYRLSSDLLYEAVAADAKFTEEYMKYLGNIADKAMFKTLARYSGERRERFRSKLILLCLMLHTFGAYTVNKGVQFPGLDPIQALAEIWWTELFTPFNE